MKKFKVKMTRVETYERVVEIEANSIDEAVRKVKDNERENEYYAMFDSPDDVETTFEPATEED